MARERLSMGGWDARRVLETFHVSRESLARLEALAGLLEAWQPRINLVAPSTLPDLWGRHIADSLQLAPFIPSGAVIADLGSGAGFPGLVLAIATGCETHLFESNGKKAAFLREAARVTRAPAVVHGKRIESSGHAIRAGVVTARALAPLALLLEHSDPWFRSGAKGLFLKGQDVDAEVAEATKSWDFVYTSHPSLTDSRGVILEITQAKRKSEGPDQ